MFAADGSCWAVFELRGFDYNLQSLENKRGILESLTLFIANVASEAKFMIIPVAQDVDVHYERLTGKLNTSDPLYDYAADYCENTREHLKERDAGGNGESVQAVYKTFMSVKLHKADVSDYFKDLKASLNFLCKTVYSHITTGAGLDTRDIAIAKVAGFARFAEQVRTEQSRRLEIAPVDGETIRWLLCRNMYRGLPEDAQMYADRYSEKREQFYEEVELVGDLYIRPETREIESCFDGTITKDKSGRMLAVKHDFGTSYQSFLAFSKYCKEFAFPGLEWIYSLQQTAVNAEMYVHIKISELHTALKHIDNKRREVNSQFENIAKAKSDPPQDLLESAAEIEELEAELKAANSPMLWASATICVAGDNADIVNANARELIVAYGEHKFNVPECIIGIFI